ncbi:hypothetical protein LR48_Vigan07g149300 [Vigna angularis]|uniref:Uncharacterized protein n=1 Tax=Phaseolus angularis TaxID=3914 RepID=A0A0L9UZ08_PHAAN|nr:hypothetical protein LR48_Vigan07g149300 [Vigna angularis]
MHGWKHTAQRRCSKQLHRPASPWQKNFMVVQFQQPGPSRLGGELHDGSSVMSRPGRVSRSSKVTAGSTSEPTLKELLEQITMQNIQCQKMNMQFKQESMETQAAIQNLTDQIRQMATLAPEETDEYFKDQAGTSSYFEPGRPLSFSTNIPQFDDYAVERYVDNYIVAEHDFNFPSMHAENNFVLSDLNVSSPCTEHEFEFVVDNACNFEIDSCSEDVSEVQHITLDLGVIPLHEISVAPFCTNPIAGGTNEFDQHTPTVENKGAYTDSSKINMHLLNPLSNNICCLDPAVEDISLLDQIWRMKQFVLNNFMLDPEEKNISLQFLNCHF